MAGITASCANELQNIGAIACTKNNPFLDIVSLLVFKSGTVFESFVDFADKTKHEDLIRLKKMFPIHEVLEIDDNSEDFVYYESPTGARIPRRLGKYRHTFRFDKSLEVHKALQSFRNANVDVMLVDSAGIISAYSPDGVSVRGFSVAMFNPEKMSMAGQDNTPAWTPIAVDQLDAKEWNMKGISILPGWAATMLQPVTSVRLKKVSAAAGRAVINVAYIDGINGDGSENAIGISGIVVDAVISSDFVFIGAVPTWPGVDEGDGNYSFNGATMNTGSVSLRAPKDAFTTGDPIEAIAPLPLT